MKKLQMEKGKLKEIVKQNLAETEKQPDPEVK
jgi:hypothetical protein